MRCSYLGRYLSIYMLNMIFVETNMTPGVNAFPAMSLAMLYIGNENENRLSELNVLTMTA